MLTDKLCECGCGQPVTLAKKTNAKNGHVKGMPLRFLRSHSIRPRGALHPRWKGGQYRDKGYLVVQDSVNPRRQGRNYIYEHLLIAERALGHSLPPKSEVHHVNSITSDNSSLVLCQDRAYHMLLHQRTRAYAACGHADWRRCTFCKVYDDPKNMSIIFHGQKVYHRACQTAYKRGVRGTTTFRGPYAKSR